MISDTLATLADDQRGRIVFLWDELPSMIANISKHRDPLVGREILDVLRATREAHPAIRMVFSGSMGLHHVVSGLEYPGAAWAPVNDMLLFDLAPIGVEDATYLAHELLGNEGVACQDLHATAAAVAHEVEAVPYYVHLTVQALLERQRRTADPIDVSEITPLVEARLRDPLDQWQLLHYVKRLTAYYGEDARTVTSILDIVATARGPLPFDDLQRRLAATSESPPAPDEVRDFLDLLGKDHYLVFEDDSVAFRLDHIRRAWVAKRHLSA